MPESSVCTKHGDMGALSEQDLRDRSSLATVECTFGTSRLIRNVERMHAGLVVSFSLTGERLRLFRTTIAYVSCPFRCGAKPSFFSSQARHVVVNTHGSTMC